MSEIAFDFAGLKFQEHLNVFLVVFKYMNTLRTLQTILKIVLSAFQIVKELITSNEVTIFKSTIANALKDGGANRDRTDDLFAASEALSQLSYSPT